MRIPVRGGVDLAGIIADVASSFSRGCGADTVAKAFSPLPHPWFIVFKQSVSAARSALWGPTIFCEAEASKMQLGTVADQKTQTPTCS